MTITAAIAVLLASCSLSQITLGLAWLGLATGAVACVALAGTLTRLPPLPAAAGATALAALALAPTITSPHNWVKLAGLVVVAVCASSAWTVRPLPFVASAASYLAAPFLFLNVVLAGRESFARLVPTARSLQHLLTLAHQGASLTQYVPPVPDISGLQLLLAGGVALAAIATDVIAVRQRQPALAGLPLAVLFLAPAATTAKLGGLAGTFEFLLAAVGYLSLLAADGRARLRDWGKLVTVWHQAADDQADRAEVGQLSATGRRIGLAAATIAVIAPLVLPAAQLLRQSHPGSHGRIVEVALPNPVVQLQGLLTRRTIQPVLSYRTTAADPSGNYLQIYVLNYDQPSNSWRMILPGRGVPVSAGPLPTPAEILAGTPQVIVTSKITLDQITGFAWPVHFLPVPYWPVSLRIPGSWREDLATQMIYSGVTPLARLSYTVTSAEPAPSRALLNAPQQVPASIARTYLGYTAPVTAQLRALTAEIVHGRRSAYAQAVALEHWFLAPGRFTYTLRPNLPSTPEGLLRFLTTSRRGYCQQFAFAFAVLARLLGIPSRIAVGYTAGQRQADGTWAVTTADAHAWPELYFAGAGWLRFEPTPGGADGQGTAVVPFYAPAPSAPAGTGPTAKPSAGPTPLPGQNSQKLPNPRLKEPGGGTSLPAAHQGLSRAGWIAVLSGALAAVLIAALPALIRARTRRRRWRAAAGDTRLAVAAWQEISDTLIDFGLPHLPSDSPRAIARTILAASAGQPPPREAAGRITAAVEQAFYGPPDNGDDGPGARDRDPFPVRTDGYGIVADEGTRWSATAIRADVAEVRTAIARSAGWVKRLRARLLPTSTLRPFWSVLRIVVGIAEEEPELTELTTRQEQTALAGLSAASGELAEPLAMVRR